MTLWKRYITGIANNEPQYSRGTLYYRYTSDVHCANYSRPFMNLAKCECFSMTNGHSPRPQIFFPLVKNWNISNTKQVKMTKPWYEHSNGWNAHWFCWLCGIDCLLRHNRVHHLSITSKGAVTSMSRGLLSEKRQTWHQICSLRRTIIVETIVLEVIQEKKNVANKQSSKKTRVCHHLWATSKWLALAK